MKITLHLIIALMIVAGIVATSFSFWQVSKERYNMSEELEGRAVILAESLEVSVVRLMESENNEKLLSLVERFGNRKKLAGVAVHDDKGTLLAATKEITPYLGQHISEITDVLSNNKKISSFKSFGGRTTHLYVVPIEKEGALLGTLAILHNAMFIDAKLAGIWKENFIRFLVLALLTIVTTIIIVRWSITGPIANLAFWLNNLRAGRLNELPIALSRGDILAPLVKEVNYLAKTLSQTRAKTKETQSSTAMELLWTSERLKEHIRSELGEHTLFVVSNREPYMHIRRGSQIECLVPAGGLVTALDPVLRACQGMWIAHGSSDADWETCDKNGKIRVPPDHPLYTLRRVSITKEEEEGYYYGFSNEGMWPLCHITHTRPIFRLEDWKSYQKVNQKFADVLLEEIKNEKTPLVIIQDYHFALLPFLIKSARPDACVAIFWHIPWPNPEAFGICPWKEELLMGLLGADLIGFQIQFHCNNFLDTVDRFLESKIAWDQLTVERHKHITSVKPFPISVDFPDIPPVDAASVALKRAEIFNELGIKSEIIGIGVDRIDYTKGIIERFRAIERFMEKYPEFLGRVTFVELGAPSRTHLKRYHELVAEIEETAERINWRYQTTEWKPLVLLTRHHNREDIYRYYKSAHFCMVTSLHDGMNLVAKEFVACRGDNDGVLILSQFAGAARELQDALIVNPYDIEGMADAIYRAISMTYEERAARMTRLRTQVRERNIYRWAANLVTALARLPVNEQHVIQTIL